MEKNYQQVFQVRVFRNRRNPRRHRQTLHGLTELETGIEKYETLEERRKKLVS